MAETEAPGLPPHPDPVLASRGLPDFSAMIAAEFAAAPAIDPAATSSLGVGELILTARELTGLSQRRLAALAGTSQAAVTAMETGNRLPTIRTIMRIADAAGFEVIVGLRRRGAAQPVVVGALLMSDDGLADFQPMRAPSPFDGPERQEPISTV